MNSSIRNMVAVPMIADHARVFPFLFINHKILSVTTTTGKKPFNSRKFHLSCTGNRAEIKTTYYCLYRAFTTEENDFVIKNEKIQCASRLEQDDGSGLLELSHVSTENSAFPMVHGVEDQEVVIVAPDWMRIETAIEAPLRSFGQCVDPHQCPFGIFHQIKQPQRYFSIFCREFFKPVTIGYAPASVTVE